MSDSQVQSLGIGQTDAGEWGGTPGQQQQQQQPIPQAAYQLAAADLPGQQPGIETPVYQDPGQQDFNQQYVPQEIPQQIPQEVQNPRGMENATAQSLNDLYDYDDPSVLAPAPPLPPGQGVETYPPGNNQGVEQLPPYSLTPDLLARGSAMGIPYNDMRAMGADLPQVLQHREFYATQNQPLVQNQPVPPNGDGGQGGESQGLELKMDPIKLELDPEQWDADTTRSLETVMQKQQDQFLKTMQDQLLPQLQQGQENFQAIQQHLQIQEEARMLSEFDTMVQSLGPQWQGTFGNGSLESQQSGGQHQDARFRVMQNMQVIQTGRQGQGLPPQSMRELFNTALVNTFPQQQRTMHRRDMGQQLQNITKTARPTQRIMAGPQPSVRDKAIGAATAAFNRHRIPIDTYEDEGLF